MIGAFVLGILLASWPVVAGAQTPYVSPNQGLFPEVFAGGYHQSSWYYCFWKEQYSDVGDPVSYDPAGSNCYELYFDWVDSGFGSQLLLSREGALTGSVGAQGGSNVQKEVLAFGILPPASAQTVTVQCDVFADESTSAAAAGVNSGKSAFLYQNGGWSLNSNGSWVGSAEIWSVWTAGMSRSFDTFADEIAGYAGGTSNPGARFPMYMQASAIAPYAPLLADAGVDCHVTSYIPWPDFSGDAWIPPVRPDLGIVPVPLEITPVVSVPNTITFGVGEVSEPACYTILPAWSVPFSVTVGGRVFGGDQWDDYGVCVRQQSLAFEFFGINWGLMIVGVFGVGAVGVLFRILKAA